MNGVILVIGSDSPWIETLLLDKGAAKIITLEYAKITVQHPNITIMSPKELKILYSQTKEPIFDAVVSFSSIEHSGLGRYGEALNPWGDLITMAKSWCLTKLGGKFLLGKQMNTSHRPTSSQMSTFNFKHFLCNLFPTFFRNAIN